MKRWFVWAFVLFAGMSAQAQSVSGRVLEEENGDEHPIENASIFWLHSTYAEQSDSTGNFRISRSLSDSILIISYVGYVPDTLKFGVNDDSVTIHLHSKTQLKSVEINARQSSTYLSSLNAIKTEIITTAELCKAACCNLSESFETNNSVDVSSTDAITGAKQITMLGLSGIYTQFTQENLPSIRGLSATAGLQQLPGTWIESIQISKGVGSVANGVESITGQINIELKKPFSDETLLLNGYVNQMGRTEGNLVKAFTLNDKWGTVSLLHYDRMKNPIDRNKDKFMDVTDGQQWNAMSRWMYRSGKNISAQFGVQALNDQRRAGTVHGDEAFDALHDWRFSKDVNRIDAFGKFGYIFPEKRYKSFGVLGNAQVYRQRSTLGNRWYNADQQSLYGSAIYQSIIGNSNHKFRTGMNVQYDHMEEYFNGLPFLRKELIAGAFFEYTLTAGRSMLVAGIRADHNSLYGKFITPRLHYKYQLSEKTAFRLSGGRGQRTANVIEENLSYLASSRLLLIAKNPAANGLGYGLMPEIAWNGGTGWNTSFDWLGQEGSLSLDVYGTWFQRQVVIDLDASPQQMRIYNQDGHSQAISSQVDYNQTISKRFDVRLSYKYTSTQTRYLSGTFERPFVAPHRVLFNVAYHSRKDKWLVDFTANYIASKRLPSSALNPEQYRAVANSPEYVVVHAQVTRNLKRWAVYVGVENLLDVYQNNQIISADNPHSIYFDASYAWGPNFGRMMYAGFRYRIAKG